MIAISPEKGRKEGRIRSQRLQRLGSSGPRAEQPRAEKNRKEEEGKDCRYEHPNTCSNLPSIRHVQRKLVGSVLSAEDGEGNREKGEIGGGYKIAHGLLLQ